jgi:hypothetical protein
LDAAFGHFSTGGEHGSFAECSLTRLGWEEGSGDVSTASGSAEIAAAADDDVGPRRKGISGHSRNIAIFTNYSGGSSQLVQAPVFDSYNQNHE